MPQEIGRLQFLLIPEKAKTAVTLPAAAAIRILGDCFGVFQPFSFFLIYRGVPPWVPSRFDPQGRGVHGGTSLLWPPIQFEPSTSSNHPRTVWQFHCTTAPATLNQAIDRSQMNHLQPAKVTLPL